MAVAISFAHSLFEMFANQVGLTAIQLTKQARDAQEDGCRIELSDNERMVNLNHHLVDKVHKDSLSNIHENRVVRIVYPLEMKDGKCTGNPKMLHRCMSATVFLTGMENPNFGKFYFKKADGEKDDLQFEWFTDTLFVKSGSAKRILGDELVAFLSRTDDNGPAYWPVESEPCA